MYVCIAKFVRYRAVIHLTLVILHNFVPLKYNYIYVCVCMYALSLYRNNQTGGFSEEGIMITDRSNETFIECVSNHLTSFAILVSTQTVSVYVNLCSTHKLDKY